MNNLHLEGTAMEKVVRNARSSQRNSSPKTLGYKAVTDPSQHQEYSIPPKPPRPPKDFLGYGLLQNPI